MKRAYVDMTLDSLGDLLRLWRDDENLLRGIAPSPLGDEHVRLVLSGDGLPDTFSDEPKRAKVCYEGSIYSLRATIYQGDLCPTCLEAYETRQKEKVLTSHLQTAI